MFGGSLDWHIGWIRDLDEDTRRSLYQTLTTLTGTLLGLTLTSVSILAGLMKQDLSAATGGLLNPRRQHQVSGLFFAGLRGLGVALIVSFALLVSQGGIEAGSRWAQSLTLAVVTLVGMRLGRIIWVLALVLRASVGIPAKPEYEPISDDEDE